MDNKISYWLALNFVPGIGRVNYLNLIRSLGGPKEVFRASKREILSVDGMGQKTVDSIKDFKEWPRVEKEMRMIEKFGVNIVTFLSPSYPERLKEITDPPPLLYIRGTLRDSDRVAVAIIGSRRASDWGLRMTRDLAEEMVRHGIAVVSGMARGADSASHRGAIKGGGRTLAVLGCGVDRVYPPENKGLMEKIIEYGAVISELPIGTLPEGVNFPARNRIISGLSLGVVIVEAQINSGSLITARLALEQGREVFAVPGNVLDRRSRGTNKLIKEGAKLVESARDIIEEILPQVAPKEPVQKRMDFSPDESTVFRLLENGPTHIDTIIKQTGLNPGVLSNVLLSMELSGIIEQLPGNFYIEKKRW